LFAVGPITSNVTLGNNLPPSAKETYRAQPRTTTSCYEVDGTDAPGGGIVYLCSLQDRTIVRSVIVECTASFDSGSTFSMGTQLGGYTDFFPALPNPAAIPAAGGVLVSSLEQYQIANTWTMNGQSAVALTLDQAPPQTAKLRIYLTTEVVQAA
jgi:hypothetical protein